MSGGSFSLMILLGFYIGSGCSSSDDVQICQAESAIDLQFGNCLVFLDNGQLDTERAAIEDVARRTVALVNEKMPLEDLEIKIKVSPANTIPEIGIGGFNPNEQEVIISMNPGFPDFSRTISKELEPQLAHEMHHAKRRRHVGYGNTLLQACISEGLADWFSIEVAGIDPPIWSTSLQGEELEEWIQKAESTWNDTGYDHNAWFVGTSVEVPRWTGYAIGFQLVKEYLEANAGLKASALFDEPASSFVEE